MGPSGWGWGSVASGLGASQLRRTGKGSHLLGPLVLSFKSGEDDEGRRGKVGREKSRSHVCYWGSSLSCRQAPCPGSWVPGAHTLQPCQPLGVCAEGHEAAAWPAALPSGRLLERGHGESGILTEDLSALVCKDRA